MKKTITFLITSYLLISTNLVLADLNTGCTKPLNEKYSFRDLFNLTFTEKNAEEFNNTCIKGSNFYQESLIDDVEIMRNVFPSDIEGVEFVGCNLDNVIIPEGAVLKFGNSNRKIKVQNDLEDWVLNEQDNLIEPINKETFINLELSINPLDIPNEKKDRPITIEKKDTDNKNKQQ